MQTQITNSDKKNGIRNSGIEALKIFAVILIIISHVIGTLRSGSEYYYYYEYIIDLNLATDNIQYLILSMLQSSGSFGNIIFFVCSAWFLLDSNKVNKRKILQMLLDIWVVSVIILIAVYILRSGDIRSELIKASIFPTTYSNNWYMTCYLLFYPIHPFLNMVINKAEKQTLLKTTLVMLFLYFGMYYCVNGLLFFSQIILWIVIYFVIAYMKLYLVDISNNIKINTVLFFIGFIGNYGIVIIKNILGHDNLLRWFSDYSPFILLMVIGLFNIARNAYFESKIINYVSGLSLLIYIIHENLLLRTYYRPMLWRYIYIKMSHDHVLLWTFVIVAIVFDFGLISSVIYKHTIQKLVIKAGDVLYPALCKLYSLLEKKLLKLH